MPRLDRNPVLLCVLHGLQMSLFPMAVITIFYQRQIGLSLGEILLLQAVFGLAMVLTEFPSGYLADRLGYRRTLITAALAMLGGWGAYCAAVDVVDVVIAEVLLGVGTALISGCDTAMLYESLLETGREKQYARWNGRFVFCGQSAEGFAALAAGALYALHPRAVFFVQLAVWLAALGVARALAEPHRPPAARRHDLARMAGMIRRVLREDGALRAVFGLAVVLGMASYVPVWTVPLLATGAGVDAVWLGPIWCVANLTVAFGALCSHRLEERVGFDRAILACIALVVAGYLGLGLAAAWWGFAFYFLLTVMRGLYGPIVQHREQRLVPSSDRAGFLSLRSFAFRGAFMLLAFVVGPAMDRHGQHVVLLALGGALALLALVASRSARRHMGAAFPPRVKTRA